MIVNKEIEFKLAAYNATLFNVCANTKLITSKVEENRKLVIWVYLDQIPTDDEKDMYYSISSEIASHFTELDDSISEVFFIQKDYDESQVKNKLVLFARTDLLDENRVLIE